MTTMKMAALVALAALAVACSGGEDGNPTSPSGSGPTARPEVNGLTATGQVWNQTLYRYSANFNLIERGGVPIVIDSVTADPLMSTQSVGMCTFTVAGTGGAFVSSRLGASENFYSRTLICERAVAAGKATSLKVNVGWNDDNGHRGTATATVAIVF